MNRIKKITVVIGAAPLLIAAATAASAASAPAVSSNYNPTAPVRILDTRTGTGAPKAAVGAQHTLTLTVAGSDSVPAGATAVTLNVTETAPTAGGYLTVYPDGATRTNTSNLDFGPGQTTTNLVTVPLTDGKVDFYNGSGGTVQIVADLQGWYTAAPDAYTAPTPVTKDLGAVASVPTGGGFVANATEAGTLDLKAGTYQLSLSAKATPDAAFAAAHPDVQVFPQFFVYSQIKNAAFAGDLFNVGSGALESGGNANIDAYFTGSTVITLAADTTLHMYADGYDADRGAGDYTLDDLAVSAIPLG